MADERRISHAAQFVDINPKADSRRIAHAVLYVDIANHDMTRCIAHATLYIDITETPPTPSQPPGTHTYGPDLVFSF